MTWPQLVTLIVAIAAAVAVSMGGLYTTLNGIQAQVATFQAEAARDRRAMQARTDALRAQAAEARARDREEAARARAEAREEAARARAEAREEAARARAEAREEAAKARAETREEAAMERRAMQARTDSAMEAFRAELLRLAERQARLETADANRAPAPGG